jgi:hypothetical protein
MFPPKRRLTSSGLHVVIINRDSSVGIAVGDLLDGRSLIPVRFFSSPQSPDRVWDPPSLVSSEYLQG